MRVTVRREDSDGKTRDKNRDEDRPHPHRARLSYLGASPGGPPLTRRGFAPERKV